MKSIIDKIDKRQYGSLKRSSTTHALLSFIHHLLGRSDEPKNVIRIFLLEFAKAFDNIDHKILLRKLSSMEVPPIIISWIKNFLTEREQRVKIGLMAFVCPSGKELMAECPKEPYWDQSFSWS
jgi:hypothetical protein